MKEIYLSTWEIDGDRIKLTYKDKSVLFVKKTDFNRAFGCIVSATKSAVQRDFAINV